MNEQMKLISWTYLGKYLLLWKENGARVWDSSNIM